MGINLQDCTNMPSTDIIANLTRFFYTDACALYTAIITRQLSIATQHAGQRCNMSLNNLTLATRHGAQSSYMYVCTIHTMITSDLCDIKISLTWPDRSFSAGRYPGYGCAKIQRQYGHASTDYRISGNLDVCKLW